MTKELGVSVNTVYHWLQNDTNGFAGRYKTSKQQQVDSLVDDLVEKSKTIGNDEAMATKVRAGIVQWVAARYNATQKFLIISIIMNFSRCEMETGRQIAACRE
mgnify:CR=1 FL=1